MHALSLSYIAGLLGHRLRGESKHIEVILDSCDFKSSDAKELLENLYCETDNRSNIARR